jgi:hypothetical protein
MAANPTIGESIDAFRELLKIRKSHGDVEPIQHVLSFGRNLLLDGSQTGIPIGKNCDRRGFGDSALAHGKIDRSHRLGTSIAHEGKTGGMPIAIQRLPCNHFEVSFRPLVSISDVPTIQLHDQFFTLRCDEPVASASADFCSRLPTFIVRLRTVLAVACADNGRSSPRKSATFRNGSRAAILAVRYRNSGVIGLLFVNSVEKLSACHPEHGHLLTRRIRMPTFPYTERRVDWYGNSPSCVMHGRIAGTT